MEASRPSVSVVVPFAGSADDLGRLADRLQRLVRRQDDEVIIADNRRPGAKPLPDQALPGDARLVRADRVPGPGAARNAGAAVASGAWLLFIDADTQPDAGLLESYFDPAPDPGTAVLAGVIADVASRSNLLARHDVARERMSQEMTLRRRRPYAQTANCAVLRSAFEDVGGFDEQARGEDADLCFRLFDAGWRLEERPLARVEHQAKVDFSDWLSQQVRHGQGAGWLDRRYPGEFPPRGWRFLANRLGHLGAEAVSALIRGQRAEAGFALLDLIRAWAFELGRLGAERPRRWR